MGFMSGKIVSGALSDKDLCKLKEAVCVQVEKVYDSCKEKDCIEDSTVIFKNPKAIQCIINKAINVKCRRTEVLDVYIDVEPVPFKKGFYTVDVKFFIKVVLDFFIPNGVGPAGTTIVTRCGLVIFDKKVILFGSEGNVKIFKSKFVEHAADLQVGSCLQQDNLPVGKVEVAEPIGLNARIQDILDKLFDDCHLIENTPRSVADALGDEDDGAFVEEADDRHGGHIPLKRVVATIGLFSIIKLVRYVQLLVPAFDFCIPPKECVAATEENPCEFFETIEFPMDEFFPPQKFEFPGALEVEGKLKMETES